MSFLTSALDLLLSLLTSTSGFSTAPTDVIVT
jgi:hypothetical protein